MSLSLGTGLAQYEIVSHLGSGGMGDVYRARDSPLERDVAIKVLSDQLAGDPDMRARFEREAQAVAALSDPNILAIHEFGVVQGLAFAVMELLEGETLRARLQRSPLAWREAAEIAAAVGDALSAAHVKGIIHRDLKPENIFLTVVGGVKVLDFGLARRRALASVPTGAAAGDTRPGLVVGTPGYLAPEQLEGREADERSDIFTLGCALYEMLTRQRAFLGATVQEILDALRREAQPGLSTAPRDTPDQLVRIVTSCLERDPGRRFQSARDVALALRAALADSGTTAARPARQRRIRSVAVLPLENVGAKPDTEYLSDGITESIINSLSQLSGLRVVPRSLVFRYKDQPTDLRMIALTLNADALVTGRVTQYGEVLNLQVELVDVLSEAQLWGEQYKRQLSDLVAVQEEIAWHVSEALRVKLTRAQKQRLHRRPTVNAECYQEYLRGRFHWAR